MSKVLKKAAIVVGAVALIATGVGAIAGGTILGASIATIGTLASVAAGALNLATTLVAKPKGSAVGSQTDVRLDPQAGVPYAIGRTYYAGTLVHQDTFGADNTFIGSVIAYSGGGPITAFEAWQVDRATVTFTGGAADGGLNGFLWLTSQLGATPEAAALVSSQGTLPGWDAASKLSGYAAALWTLKFDKNGKKWAGGYPQIGAVVQGAKAYDPRLDSTYPGGSGAHRANNEATWAYTENPWLHALAWAIGRHQNGKRVLGVGMPIDAIDVASFVDAANVAGTNLWKVGGVVSSSDDKWDVLKMLCQAGGGQPVRLGGELSCDFETSRVSLATVTSADLVGEGSVVGTQRRRDRYNTAIPRCRLETHGWEVVALDQIAVASYVTEDGDTRTREIDLPLVQNKDQAAQLATYDIVSSREFGPIVLPLKIKWIGYKPGDCLTLTIAELGLSAQKAVITRRELDPESGVVTLELKSETDSKHAFALGKTGVAPTTPGLTPIDLSSVAAPGAAAWTLAGASVSTSAGSLPALQVTGAVDNVNAETVQFEVRLSGESDAAWRIAGQGGPETVKRLITDSIAPGASYQVAVSYIARGVTGARRVLGPAAAGTLGIDYGGVTGPTRPVDNATKNIVSRQATAPASPIDGDVWVDTSVVPNLIKVRVAGIWQTASNLVVNTSEITDGALLGQTAIWASVSGTGRPDSFATSGDNMIRDPNFALATLREGRTLSGSRFSVVTLPAGSPAAKGLKYSSGTYPTGQTQRLLDQLDAASLYPNILGGQTYYFGMLHKPTRVSGTAPFYATLYLDFFDSASSLLGGTGSISLTITATGAWAWSEASAVAPAGAVSARLRLDAGDQVDGVAEFDWFMTGLSLSRTQLGATVGTPAGTTVAGRILDGATVGTSGSETALNIRTRASRLSTSSGQALSNFIASDGRSYGKIAGSYSTRDDVAFTFPSALPAVPKITFLPGGIGPGAGKNIKVVAENLTVSGFTLRAKEQTVTPGTTYTDSTVTAGGTGEPSSVIDRSNGSVPYDGKFTFRVSSTVGNIAPGEPGYVEVALYLRQAGAWVQVATVAFSATKTDNDVGVFATCDFGAGSEFGMSIVRAEGSGSTASLVHARYTAGTVTETSLTPTGSSDIPFITMLQ